jgi:hypothetical protein
VSKSNNKKKSDPHHYKMKWATFTYSGKGRKKNCKTQIKVAFRRQNTIQNRNTPIGIYETIAWIALKNM